MKLKANMIQEQRGKGETAVAFTKQKIMIPYFINK
jgi:hypothetical protein